MRRPSAATTSEARPCNTDQLPGSMAETAFGSYGDDPLVKPNDWPDVPDEYEYLTLPDDVPE